MAVAMAELIDNPSLAASFASGPEKIEKELYFGLPC